jgi:hypothetical protein
MKKNILIFVTLLLVFLGLEAQKVRAADLSDEQSLYIDNLEVNINILKNGDLVSTEAINFASEPTLPFKWPIFASNVSNIKVKNGSEELTNKDFSISHTSGLTTLNIKKGFSANSWNISYRAKNQIKYYKDYDELSWVVFFKNGALINKANIFIKYPFTLENSTQQKIYAYGVNTTKIKKDNQQTFFYQAENIDPQGNFTVVGRIQKGLFMPSFLGRILSYLSGLDFLAGILLALILFLVTWLTLKILSLRQKKAIMPKDNEILSSPPNDIPAPIIGVLINKKLDVREFAATIIELARQGYLIIIEQGNKLYLVKRKPFNEIKPAEKAIIDEIFEATGPDSKEISMDLRKLKSSEKEKLSSQKISTSSEHIYKIIKALKYFSADPHKVYLEYLKISIAIFFVSLLGLLLSISLISSYPFLIFIPIGLILSSFIIPQMASGLSLYTKRGKEVTRSWLAFQNYLTLANHDKENIDEFFRFLPYAIVLGVEKKWASKFPDSAHLPAWLDIGYESFDLNNFTNRFLPLIYDLACTLIETRTPTAR